MQQKYCLIDKCFFVLFQGSVGGTTPDKAATTKAQRKDKENIDVSEAQEVDENTSGTRSLCLQSLIMKDLGHGAEISLPDF